MKSSCRGGPSPAPAPRAGPGKEGDTVPTFGGCCLPSSTDMETVSCHVPTIGRCKKSAARERVSAWIARKVCKMRSSAGHRWSPRKDGASVSRTLPLPEEGLLASPADVKAQGGPCGAAQGKSAVSVARGGGGGPRVPRQGSETTFSLVLNSWPRPRFRSHFQQTL